MSSSLVSRKTRHPEGATAREIGRAQSPPVDVVVRGRVSEKLFISACTDPPSPYPRRALFNSGGGDRKSQQVPSPTRRDNYMWDASAVIARWGGGPATAFTFSSRAPEPDSFPFGARRVRGRIYLLGCYDVFTSVFLRPCGAVIIGGADELRVRHAPGIPSSALLWCVEEWRVQLGAETPLPSGVQRE
ncbi:hypothetical protein TNCV_2857951 [Trichonephila clavipes]|nr:hypothetical protein TNCV_2857951 [Trichonephila clavipes]